jgi:hypothetical protein
MVKRRLDSEPMGSKGVALAHGIPKGPGAGSFGPPRVAARKRKRSLPARAGKPAINKCNSLLLCQPRKTWNV